MCDNNDSSLNDSHTTMIELTQRKNQNVVIPSNGKWVRSSLSKKCFNLIDDFAPEYTELTGGEAFHLSNSRFLKAVCVLF